MGELHYFDTSVHQKVLDQTSNVILDPNSHLPPKETSPDMHIRALCSGINALRLLPILQEVRKKAVCTGNRRASHPLPLAVPLPWLAQPCFPNEGLTTHIQL